MKTDLLLKLADLLDTIPDGRFDFTRWASSLDLADCGTAACALGWATTIPECGLSLVKLNTGSTYVKHALSNAGGVYDVNIRSLSSAMAAFEITYVQANRLFMPDYDDESPSESATSAEVAEHIRRFVEDSQ